MSDLSDVSVFHRAQADWRESFHELFSSIPTERRETFVHATEDLLNALVNAAIAAAVQTLDVVDRAKNLEAMAGELRQLTHQVKTLTAAIELLVSQLPGPGDG